MYKCVVTLFKHLDSGIHFTHTAAGAPRQACLLAKFMATVPCINLQQRCWPVLLCPEQGAWLGLLSLDSVYGQQNWARGSLHHIVLYLRTEVGLLMPVRTIPLRPLVLFFWWLILTLETGKEKSNPSKSIIRLCLLPSGSCLLLLCLHILEVRISN